MTKHFCDRCDQEIKYPLILHLSLDPEGAKNKIEQTQYELCNQCAKFIQQTIELNR